MKVVRPVIASNGVSYLQLKLVGSHSTSGREKEREDEQNISNTVLCAGLQREKPMSRRPYCCITLGWNYDIKSTLR